MNPARMAAMIAFAVGMTFQASLAAARPDSVGDDARPPSSAQMQPALPPTLQLPEATPRDRPTLPDAQQQAPGPYEQQAPGADEQQPPGADEEQAPGADDEQSPGSTYDAPDASPDARRRPAPDSIRV